MAYYNGKKVLSVVQVKEVEVDYYVGVATLETEKKDEIIVPQNIKVNNTNFPILDGTKTSIVELGGNSVSFNQLVSDTQIFYSGSNLSVDYNNTTHQYTFKTNSTDWAVSNANNFTWINGHKYLVKINLISKTENAKLRLRYPTIITETSIITPTENLNLFGVQIQSTDGNEATIIFTINVFDLTRMSLDNITSVDEFKALFPLDIYPYNSGEIKSTILSKIESWGANLFDKANQGLQYSDVYISSVGTSGGIGANNFSLQIPCKPNTTYTIYRLSIVSSRFRVVSYPTKISGSVTLTNHSVKDGDNKLTITTGTNDNYLIINLDTNEANFTNQLETLIVALGDRTFSDYKPYVGKLGQINIPNAPLKLNGVNDIHDLLTFEEQSDGSYNAILEKEIESYTFTGNETIQNLPQYGENFMGCDVGSLGFKNETAPLFNKGVFKKGTISDLPEASCYLYGRNLYYNIGTNDEQANRDFVNGLTMYFQLATPTTEVIATGLTFDQVATLFEKGGTLKIGNANTDYVQTNSTMAFAVRRFRSVEE